MQTTKRINKFLGDFPKEATCWSEATDELREFSRAMRMAYNDENDLTEGDAKFEKGLNFGSFKTPGEQNTKARGYIVSLTKKMSKKSLTEVVEKHSNWL